MNNNKFTIKELAALKVDVDIYNDVTDDVAPAFCGPLLISGQGAVHFENVLNIVGKYNELENSFVLELDKPDWESRWSDACNFFECAAGYCSCENWNKWFEEE